MDKKTIAAAIRNMRTAVKKHSPEILTGIGIAGMITTTVMAVRATPKALILIEEKKDELEVNELTPKEIVQAAWACYIPAAVTGTVSIACLIGASSVNIRRRGACYGLYTFRIGFERVSGKSGGNHRGEKRTEYSGCGCQG